MEKLLCKWREYFDHLKEHSVLFKMSWLKEVFVPIHDEVELNLIEAESFLAYHIHHCSRILEFFKNPSDISYVPYIDH